MGAIDSKAPSAEHLSFVVEKRHRCSWCGQLREDCTCGQMQSSCRACKGYQTCQGYRFCPVCEQDVGQRTLLMHDVRDADAVVEMEEGTGDEGAQRHLAQSRDAGAVCSIDRRSCTAESTCADSVHECCICLENQANIVLKPCGHCHLCKQCLEGFVGGGRSNIICPTCRQLVSSAHELAPLEQHALERPVLEMVLQREERKSSLKGGSSGSVSYRWTKRPGALKSALKGGHSSMKVPTACA